MTLRRYAPLALSALALACAPKIEERANATTVDYALFNPAASQIPTPNDVALSSVAAFVNGAYASAPCNAAGTAQGIALCAYARSGGFPSPSPVKIGFLRGTLAASGAVSYAPAPGADAMDTATLAFAGASPTPTLGVFDLDAALPADFPVTAATSSFNATTGELTLTAPGGAWIPGHQYAVMVLGGDRGPMTLTGGAYTAMPPFYVLREAVIADLDLSLPENQGLFPGDAAARAASGAALEQLRAGYEFLYSVGGFGAATQALNLPFGDAISLQTFQIAPGTGTVTIAGGTEPTTAPQVMGGAAGLADSFTLQSNLGTATVTSVAFDLTAGDAAVATLFVNGTAACTGTTYGTSASVSALGAVTIPLTTYPPAGLTAATSLYVCANTKAVGAATPVSGTVTAVGVFPLTTYASVDNDTSDAGLVVIP